MRDQTKYQVKSFHLCQWESSSSSDRCWIFFQATFSFQMIIFLLIILLTRSRSAWFIVFHRWAVPCFRYPLSFLLARTGLEILIIWVRVLVMDLGSFGELTLICRGWIANFPDIYRLIFLKASLWNYQVRFLLEREDLGMIWLERGSNWYLHLILLVILLGSSYSLPLPPRRLPAWIYH